jgi:hypothetical protein
MRQGSYLLLFMIFTINKQLKHCSASSKPTGIMKTHGCSQCAFCMTTSQFSHTVTGFHSVHPLNIPKTSTKLTTVSPPILIKGFDKGDPEELIGEHPSITT